MREYVHSADHSSVITSLEVELSAQPRAHAPCVQYGEEGQRCSYSISRTAADESSQHQQTLPHASPASSPSRYLSFIWHCLSADSAGAASALTLWKRPRSPRISQRHFHPSFPMRLTLSGVSSLNGAEGQKVRTLEAI